MQEDFQLHQEQGGDFGYYKKPFRFFDKENFTITIEPAEEYPNKNNTIINLDEDEKDEIINLTISSESEENKHIQYTAKIYIEDEIENQPDFQKCYEDTELKEIGLELSKYFDNNQYEVQKGRNNNQILLIFKYNVILKKKEIPCSFKFEMNLLNSEKNNQTVDISQIQQQQKLQFQELKAFFEQKFETLQQKEPKENQNLEQKIDYLVQKSDNNDNRNLEIIKNLERKVENLESLLENTIKDKKEGQQDTKAQVQQKQLANSNLEQENITEGQLKEIISNNFQQLKDSQEQVLVKIKEQAEHQNGFNLQVEKNFKLTNDNIKSLLVEQQENIKEEIKNRCDTIENSMNNNPMNIQDQLDNNLKKINNIQELIQQDITIQYFYNNKYAKNQTPKFQFNFSPSEILNNIFEYTNDNSYQKLKDQISIFDDAQKMLFILKSMPKEHKEKLDPQLLMKSFDIKEKKVLDFKNELQGKENCLFLLKIKENQNSQYQYFAAYAPDKEVFDQQEGKKKWIKTKQNDINDYPYSLDLNYYHKRALNNKDEEAYGIYNNRFIVFNGDFQITDQEYNYEFSFAFSDDPYKSNLIEENNNQKRYVDVKVYCGEMEVIQLF